MKRWFKFKEISPFKFIDNTLHHQLSDGLDKFAKVLKFEMMDDINFSNSGASHAFLYSKI